MQPHLGRAVSAQFRMMDAELRNQIYSDALDRLSCGVAVLNGAGKLMLSNAAAQAVFEHGLTLKLVQERVTATIATESRKLQMLIQSALTRRELRGGATVVHGPGQRALSVMVDAASEAFRNRTGGAVYVYISDMHARPSRAHEPQVREMFGMTPAETRIAVGIADGDTLQDVAARVGVTYESARFTLKRVYEKLGVHKQGELVALIHAALPPVRDAGPRRGP
jgi:DNA-binding CsgD family transcriptional regulator